MGLSYWKLLLNTIQINNDYSEKPLGLQWRSNTFFILTTVAIGLFTDLFLYSLIVPVLPFLLEDRIGVPSSEVQSYTSALLAVLAGSSFLFSPIAGVLADRVSTRQAPFLLGLSTLIGATVLLFTARSLVLLVVARVLQGVSSAAVWTVGMAILVETVGPENLGKTVGSLFSFIQLGALWAPFIGGVLYEKAGVGGVMGIALAVLGIDLVMRILVIEKKVARKYEPEEDAATNTSTNSSSDQDGRQGNDEEQPLLAPQPEDLSEYRIPEQKSKLTQAIKILPCMWHPAGKSLLMSLSLAFVQAILLGSLDATVATVSHELFGFNSLKAGVMFLPLGITDLIFGPLVGWAMDCYGTKLIAVASYIELTPIFVLLRLPHPGGLHQIILYAGLLALIGIGLCGAGSVSIVEAGIVVDNFHRANHDFFGDSGPYAQLYGMNSALFNIGLTVGPELAGELKQAIGYGNMNLILSAMCAVTAILCFFYIGGRSKLPREDEP